MSKITLDFQNRGLASVAGLSNNTLWYKIQGFFYLDKPRIAEPVIFCFFFKLVCIINICLALVYISHPFTFCCISIWIVLPSKDFGFKFWVTLKISCANALETLQKALEMIDLWETENLPRSRHPSTSNTEENVKQS